MDRREFLGGMPAICYATTLLIRSGESGKVVVGDERLRVVLEATSSGLREVAYQVDGVALAGVSGDPWRLELGRDTLSAATSAASLVHRDGERLAVFEGSTGGVRWRTRYAVTGRGRVTKSVTIVPSTPVEVARVSLWNATSASAPVMAGTIAAFYRQGGRGLFASIDFPYTDPATEGGVLRLSYPPHDRVEAGASYACHSLTVGATRLTGVTRGEFDEGEIDAVDSYVQEHRPPRFERPGFIYPSIVNRYTQLTNAAVYYTMKDQPSFSYNTDLVERDYELMERLGMEYYQLFPGVFDWVPGDPEPKVVERLVRDAKRRGLRIGDYSACEGLFVAHYNVHSKTPEGWQKIACFGSPEFVRNYIDTVVPNCKRYGFELHCMDILGLQGCDIADHGHAPGSDSVYAQVRGLVRVVEAINGVSPQMMVWPNSGAWQTLLPKFVWYAPNQYLTDPSINSPRPGLNQTRLLDDVRREQMVSLHNSMFVPYRFFTNCQYFLSQNAVSPELRNYQYGVLSTIAVTPNLAVCEIRPWLDRIGEKDLRRVSEFYTRWTSFLEKHFDLWKKTYQAGEEPGIGSVEIYGHAEGNRGFVFVVNPNYWDRTVEVPIDGRLGFTGTGAVEIKELHPVERLRLTAQGPFARLGTTLPVTVPAQQVLVLEVGPAPAVVREPRLYGVPGTVTATSSGYRITTEGAQGTTERVGVLLPKGRVGTAVARQPKLADPRLYEPTGLRLLSSQPEGALLEVTFPRLKASTELRDWTVAAGNASRGWTGGIPPEQHPTALRFPLFTDVADPGALVPIDRHIDELRLGVLGDFCGAYVENAFSESQQAVIDLTTGGGSAASDVPMVSGEAVVRRPLHPLARDGATGWWLQTTFSLPVAYSGWGCEPPIEEHTLLVLPLVRQGRFRVVQAWVNGSPLAVQRYAYPKNRGLGCYYADLIGTSAVAGGNTLVVYLEAP